MQRKERQLFALLVLLCLIIGSCAYAQQPIRGIVVDSSSFQALPGVNVRIKNIERGTSTDDKGNFSIEANLYDTLIFSLVGYEVLMLPLLTLEPGVIRLREKYTLLEAVTIDEARLGEMYEGMFDEQNQKLRRSIPFYFSKARKEKIRLGFLKEENERVKTYVETVINNQDLKTRLMLAHDLTEREYYDVLTRFNERHYSIMYYLTRAELISLINTFFEAESP